MEKSNNDLIKQLARLQWLMHKHHLKIIKIMGLWRIFIEVKEEY